MAGLAPYLADPVIARQVTSTLARIVTQQAVLGGAAYLGAKRLRSESSNMPMFGPSKKARSEVARRTRSIKTRMSRQLQFKGTHTFVRTVAISYTVSPQNGIQTGAQTLAKGQALLVSLASVQCIGSVAVTVPIAGATDLTGLFDAWRIKRVTVQMQCTNNSSAVGGVANGLPIICSSIDGNDAVQPTGRDEITQDASFRVDRLDDTHLWKRSYYPNTTTGLSSNTVQSTELSRSSWIPTTNSAAAYAGLKLWFEPVGSTVTATSNMFMYVSITYELKDYN